MKRYNFEIQYNPRCSNYEVETIEHEEGDFVFYEDYKAQLAAAEQRAAQAERDAVRECESIALSGFAVVVDGEYAAGYAGANKYTAEAIRNRYPQHFKRGG